MEKGMKRLLISVILVIALLALPVSGALADTTATVEVTAVPSYIDISIDNTAWTLNGITGSGVLDINTTYYSKASASETLAFSDPVTDAECWHTVTNSSTVIITLKADMSAFTGGTAPMTNGIGTVGANAFAAWVSESGSDWSTDKVVMNTTGSSTFWQSPSAGDDIKIGFGVQTQTGDWTDPASQTSDIVLTAVAL